MLLVLLAVAGLGFLAAGWSRAAVSPAMTGYVMDGDFQSGLAFADGTAVGSPDYPYPVVPPGTYQVTIDNTATNETFTISGLGVDESTATTGPRTVVWTIVLAPCVLYSYTGGLHFQTSASATSTAACSKLDTQVTTPTPTTTATRPTSVVRSGTEAGNPISAVGTPLPPAPAGRTLTATLERNGTLALSLAGRRTRAVAPGRYTVIAVDRDPSRGLSLRIDRHPALALTTNRFVGTRRLALRLAPGSFTLTTSPTPSRDPIHGTVATAGKG